jgi:hypothetical protein
MSVTFKRKTENPLILELTISHTNFPVTIRRNEVTRKNNIFKKSFVGLMFLKHVFL